MRLLALILALLLLGCGQSPTEPRAICLDICVEDVYGGYTLSYDEHGNLLNSPPARPEITLDTLTLSPSEESACQ